MTPCDATRTWLLEADLADLTETGPAPTREQQHLQACEACQREASHILRVTGLLDSAVGFPGPGPDAQALIARARLESVSRPPVGREWWRAANRRWIALAAAAALGAVTLWGDREPRMPGTALTSPVGTAPIVHATTADGVAVFETENPDITVLWFY